MSSLPGSIADVSGVVDLLEPPIPEGFQERLSEANANALRVRYWDKGAGDVLVTLHGGFGRQIGEAEVALAATRRVIALEIPGFGQSSRDPLLTGPLDTAIALRAVVKEIGIERCSLMGSSMGGVIALWWATEFPDEVSALVLEAPAAMRAAAPDPAFLSDRDTYLRMCHAHPERKPWLADMPVPTVQDPAWLFALMGPDYDDVLVARMRELAVPTLVLIGTRDGLVSPLAGRHYAEVLRECFFVLVYDAAHDIKGDRPEAFVSSVEDFLSPPNFVVAYRTSVINP